jgi:hypothetical protein
MLFEDSTCYQGEWKGGKPNGYGKETYPGGSTYTGEFQNDKRHGLGIYVFSKGSVYAGAWCNGLQDGLGFKNLGKDKTPCIFKKYVAPTPLIYLAQLCACQQVFASLVQSCTGLMYIIVLCWQQGFGNAISCPIRGQPAIANQAGSDDGPSQEGRQRSS